VTFAYNPDEPRDDHGRWTDGGGGGDSPATSATRAAAAGYSDGREAPPGESTVSAWGDAVKGLSEPDGGFTVDPTTGQTVTSGIAVGGFAKSSITPAAQFFEGDTGRQTISGFIGANADRLSDPAYKLGGWHDPESGNVFLDVVKVFPLGQRDAAVAAGRANNEISVADLGAISKGDWDHAIINTGGTGGLARNRMLEAWRRSSRRDTSGWSSRAPPSRRTR
jgi:hypothetical protein